MIIRTMREEELAFAAECTAAEGWLSENRSTLEGFFLNDPDGCLLAEENGQPVGICLATFYGTGGFIGELIVRPEARGRGVGAALLNRGMQILKERGTKTIYLDGVLKAVKLYERNGFHKVCRSWRFSGRLPGRQSPSVHQMSTGDLEQVIALDKLSFGADRSFFLRRRVQQFPRLCHVMMEGDRLTAFILGRNGEDWISAGPWVVCEQAEDPGALLNTLALESGGNPISIGILNTSQQACDLVRSMGFVESTESPWRMAWGSSGKLGASPRCYAVGSAAKG